MCWCATVHQARAWQGGLPSGQLAAVHWMYCMQCAGVVSAFLVASAWTQSLVHSDTPGLLHAHTRTGSQLLHFFYHMLTIDVCHNYFK